MSVTFGNDTINPNIENPTLEASIQNPSVRISFNAPAINAKGSGTVLRELVNPQFFIGTVETLQPGEDVYCYLTGTKDAPVLNFGIPMGFTGAAGADGKDGQDGAAATIAVGTVSTGAAGTSASVTNSGTSSAAVFNFTIPKGDKGDTGSAGAAATIAVGTTTTGAAGTSASVSNSGTSSAAVFNFTIPKGDKGDTGNTGSAATIAVGSVTTGAAGSPATVTNSGTSSAAVFDFTIPKGDKGDTGAAGSMPYAVCDTGASTAQKEVTISSVTSLYDGLTVNIKFTNANSASNPTLKINSLTAKPIYQYGTTAVSTTAATTGWQAGAVVQLTYDGTGFVRDQGYNTNSTYTVTEVYCGTGATTAAKVSSNASYYVLRAGNTFDITFRYTNTKAAALTLNVNGTGAKPIYIDGTASSATNYNIPAGKYICYYDGTNYYINTNGKAPINITGKADGNHDIPAGGASGYFLKKSSATDYDVAWAAGVDLYPTGGGSSPSTDTQYGSIGTSTYAAHFDHRHPTNFPTTGTPADLGTASNGSANTYARSDHVHNSVTTGFTVTLSSASWSSNEQTVSDAKFIASGYAYMVSPSSGSFADYTSAVIYADDVSTNGQITFHCTTEPTNDITVNVVRVVA